MFDPEFVKFLMSLGVGGSIAGLMFYYYRTDVKRYTEEWKGQSQQLMKVVIDNTAAITSNTEVIRALKDELTTVTNGLDPVPPGQIERRLKDRSRP